MAKYNHCPKCGNTDEGDDILRCKECNCIHCDKCSHKSLGGFGWGDGCPDCGGERETLGTIEPDDTSSDDDGGSEYTECPNCGNTEEGTAILQCGVCGLKHCDACSATGILPFIASCPTSGCAGTRKTLGHIASKSDHDE